MKAICDHFIDPPSFIIVSYNGDGCSDKAQYKLECLSNAIYENQSSAIKVFPNPAQEYLILDVPQNSQIEWIRVHNVQGKSILTDINQNRIEISALNPGMYSAQCMLDGKLLHFSFVKN